MPAAPTISPVELSHTRSDARTTSVVAVYPHVLQTVVASDGTDEGASDPISTRPTTIVMRRRVRQGRRAATKAPSMPTPHRAPLGPPNAMGPGPDAPSDKMRNVTLRTPAIEGWFTGTALLGSRCEDCGSYFFPPERG